MEAGFGVRFSTITYGFIVPASTCFWPEWIFLLFSWKHDIAKPYGLMHLYPLYIKDHSLNKSWIVSSLSTGDVMCPSCNYIK